jgi:predicted ATP-grasp superfamily ATP-dependent carboligase|tara:strand:+ start:324 stop:695 length:372 start_codon:yes stop_codon:yes gene_type:complete
VTLKLEKTMKNLFKIVTFSFVMLLGMGSMTAQTLKQDQNTPEVIAKQKTEKLSEALGLNGDQQRAVYRALVVKENNYAKDVNGKDAMNAAVVANKKKHDEVFETSMKKALTDDQYKKWQSLRN